MENVIQQGSSTLASEAEDRYKKLDRFQDSEGLQQFIEWADELDSPIHLSQDNHDSGIQQFENTFYALTGILQETIDIDKEQKEERRFRASNGRESPVEGKRKNATPEVFHFNFVLKHLTITRKIRTITKSLIFIKNNSILETHFVLF